MKEQLDIIPAILKEGQNTVKQWEDERRSEIISFFEENVYGKAVRDYKCTYTVTDDDTPYMNGKAIRRIVSVTLRGKGESFSFPFVIFLPKNASNVPTFLFLCNRKPAMDFDRQTKHEFWSAEEIVERGFCACGFYIGDVVLDHDNGFETGLQRTFGQQQKNSWGTIAAWSFAASRIIDYLVNEPLINGEKIAVVGHSRCGKATLWCGALDTRVYLTISNNSGGTGAAISCVKDGEKIKDINTVFPHWFCDNYKKYNETMPPFDQHMLLASIAPRKLYIASSALDDWADPQAEFYSAKLAEQIYHLYGVEGLKESTFPSINHPIQKGRIAYHVRQGKHNLTLFDWEQFMNFMNQEI